MTPEQIGYIVGNVITPFLLSWAGVVIYEKVGKRKIKKNRTLIICAIGAVLLMLSVAGNAGA